LVKKVRLIFSHLPFHTPYFFLQICPWSFELYHPNTISMCLNYIIEICLYISNNLNLSHWRSCEFHLKKTKKMIKHVNKIKYINNTKSSKNQIKQMQLFFNFSENMKKKLKKIKNGSKRCNFGLWRSKSCKKPLMGKFRRNLVK